jgi:hypothetical protein
MIQLLAVVAKYHLEGSRTAKEVYDFAASKHGYQVHKDLVVGSRAI